MPETTPHDAPLRIERMSKSYGAQPVLRDISLALEKGEIFGLIGLNGAGKTTLIKSVLSLTGADEGNAWIFGVHAADTASHAGLVYLPEKFHPSRYLKGWEHLRLSCSYYRQPLDRERAAEMSELLDLPQGNLDRQVRFYSKGMAQKLGLLGSLIIDAPLLVLDEPMSGLDPRARIKLKTQLLRAKRDGRTLFFSSHILSDIEEICDRIGVLHQGRLLFTGTPDEFKRRHGGQTLEQSFLRALEAVEGDPAAKVA